VGDGGKLEASGVRSSACWRASGRGGGEPPTCWKEKRIYVRGRWAPWGTGGVVVTARGVNRIGGGRIGTRLCQETGSPDEIPTAENREKNVAGWGVTFLDEGGEREMMHGAKVITR